MSACRWRVSARLARRRAQHRADDLGPGRVVADEGDAAAGLPPRRRLAEVVEQRAEAQRLAAGQLVGERLGEQLPRLLGPLAREALEVGLDLEQPLEHRQRVAVDVEVVVGALLDPAQRLELGQQRRRDPELVDQLQPAERVGAGDQQPQLGELALAGRLRGALGLRPAPRPRCRPRSRGRARRRAGRPAAAAAGRRRSCARRPPAGPARSRSASPPKGSSASPPAERHGDRADREVAGGEVGLDAAAPQRGPRRPATRRRGRAPARCSNSAESSNALPPSPRAIAAAASRGSPATARSRSVTSRPRAASRTAPPTTQDRAAASSPSASRTASASGEPRSRSATGAHRSSLGTRGEMPQVTS